MKKKLAYGCGALVILALIVGGFLMWRLSVPPKQLESSLPATPEERAQQEMAVKKLKRQADAIHKRAKQGAKAPFAMRISEDQLNAMLAQGIEKSEKFDVENLAAKLEPNLMTLQGTAKYHGAPVTLTITGNLAQNGSEVVFNVESMWLGKFSAPDKWKERASAVVSKQLNRAIARDIGELNSVEINAGEILVRGVTK